MALRTKMEIKSLLFLFLKYPAFLSRNTLCDMLEFEWYSVKEQLIAEKHGLDIETVKQIFVDPGRIVQYDNVHSGLEERWQTLGKVKDVLFTVYTERGEKIRIITARKATPAERQEYYGTSNKGYWFIP